MEKVGHEGFYGVLRGSPACPKLVLEKLIAVKLAASPTSVSAKSALIGVGSLLFSLAEV
jgi:hypothetical protein